MKKRKIKIKKSVYYVLIGIVVFIIAILSLVKHIKYTNSYEYKLGKVGYNENQIKVLLNLKKNEIENILTRKFNDKIVTFAKQKYFIFKNLDRYIAYQKDNKSVKPSKIVSIVNVGADFDWYDKGNIKETDVNKKELMLVNKFYKLGKTYTPESIMDIPSTYAYAENSTTKEVFEAFKEMWKAAKKKDLTLIVGSSYRTYEEQEKLWNSYEMSHDEEWADDYAARAGHSEHQTGLALDIVTYNSTMDNFEESDEFKWLQKNAYKYGFILRYPKGKEDLTGYSYESWHYRYVGKEVALKMHEEDITFEEYYEYYVK